MLVLDFMEISVKMYNLLKLNLARNSLRYIIKEYKIKKLHIPYYLCNVIRKSVLKENCTPVFYHIDNKFLPLKNFKKSDFILYPDYFGICGENIEILEKEYPNLIIDNSHSFFSEPKGLACFNSARKFLPVLNGSYLWIKKSSLDLKEDKFYTDIPLNEFEIIKTENNFENFEVLKINNKVLKSIEDFDFEKIKQKRLEKFIRFHELYSGENLLNIDISKVQSPFCYPYLFKDEKSADNFVKKLENKGTLIYRYWDNMPENYSEYKFYKMLVPIPIND